MNVLSARMIQSIVETTPAPLLWVTIADYSEPFFIGIFGVLWAVFFYRRTRAFWTVPAYLTAGLALAVPISITLRQIIGQTRPFADAGFNPLVAHEADFGFPSNHAVATAVFTVVFLWFGYRGIGLAIAGLTLLTGISRVATGIHYPVDILAGWILGGGITVAVCYYRWARPEWWIPERFQTYLNRK